MSTKNLIEQYIEGWKTGDVDTILSTLTQVCVIIESHGLVYHGKEKVKQWIQNLNAAGNTVDVWNTTSFYSWNDGVVFEWKFVCTVNGKKRALDGISIAQFKNGKISYLREYRTTKPLFEV